MKRLIFALFLFACDDQSPGPKFIFDTRIPPACADKAQAFVVACAEAANPLSDEEGEDLVAACQAVAEGSFGAAYPLGFDSSECDPRSPECGKLVERWRATGVEVCGDSAVAPAADGRGE